MALDEQFKQFLESYPKDKLGELVPLKDSCKNGSSAWVFPCKKGDLEVVIKKSKPGLLPKSGTSNRKKFETINKILPKLSHKNIVRMYTSAIVSEGEDETYYLMMGYVNGGTLEDAFYKNKPSPEQFLAIAGGICDALDYLSRQIDEEKNHLAHRDVTPTNILIHRDGQSIIAKLSDFGLVSGEHTTQQTVGTPGYRAPEQKLHHRSSSKSDIFSFGAVLYELLVPGPRLFKRDDGDVVEYENEGALEERLERLEIKGNPLLTKCVKHCLAFNPDDRYHSVLALKNDLLISVKYREEAETIQKIFAGCGLKEGEESKLPPIDKARGIREPIMRILADGNISYSQLYHSEVLQDFAAHLAQVEKNIRSKLNLFGIEKQGDDKYKFQNLPPDFETAYQIPWLELLECFGQSKERGRTPDAIDEAMTAT